MLNILIYSLYKIYHPEVKVDGIYGHVKKTLLTLKKETMILS
jgi:hypothetical protein